ncbi:MAG: glycoside hydrolase family 57 protein [Dethiobacteria bacterium]|jgi:1,4-alpha-glucan branching enzyme
MVKGYISLIFHAHLPYVRHPEYERSLEEKWFFEAITECYVPLIKVLKGLVEDGIDFGVTFSLSPTLLAMLEDPFLQDRYAEYLSRLLELSQREMERTANDPDFGPLASMYHDRFSYASFIFNEKYGRRLVKAFQELQNSGKVEVITSAATHGYLPLLSTQKETIYAQLTAGIEYYSSIFGREPRGIWLPECAYENGLDEILSEVGLQYFVTATHGVLFASPRPKYGVYSPILTPEGIAVFGRDPETSNQVWSSKEGYPGDYNYREFYRDIGYDLDLDYISDFLHPVGLRSNTGLKYYRITGETNYKEPYKPDWALEKAHTHAANFLFNREKQVEYYNQFMDRPPIVVAPYDTELFGHWWFEGPQWIDYVCRLQEKNSFLKLISLGTYLDQGYPLQVSSPNPSSWGDKGYHEVWLNGDNDWIYRHLHQAAEKMISLATNHPRAEGTLKMALNQAARELLLAQSSDWPFIITAGTMDNYATNRVISHLKRFFKLEEQIWENKIDTSWLHHLQETDNLFPNLDYSLFHSLAETVPVEKQQLIEVI